MQLDPDKVPNTMEEAVAMIIAGLSDEDKETLRSPDTSPASLYVGFTMFIRNSWSFWEDTPLRRDCIKRWRIAHADDVSGLLMAWIVAEVRGETFDAAACCQRFHEHWKSHDTTSLREVDVPEGEDKFAIFCDTLYQGTVPVGTVHESDGPVQWLTFDTEREAQLDIIDDLEEHIRQFKEGEREFDAIPVDLFALPVTLHPDGSLSTEHDHYPSPENANQEPT